MTPIPIAHERAQGTLPKGYFGLPMASWHGPSHLLEGRTVSTSADPLSFADLTVCLVSITPATRAW